MPPRAKSPPVHTLVVDALQAGEPLSTQQLLQAARAAAGRPFHVNSVRNALKSLKASGALATLRNRRTLLYSLRPSAAHPAPRPRRGASTLLPRGSPGDLGDLILEALRHGAPMTAESLRQYATREGGRTYRILTVRAALRALDREGDVEVVRKGREFRYTLSAGGTPVVAPVLLGAPIHVAQTGLARDPGAAAPPPQKLAPGEAVILHVGETHVETATNVHGKVVLERHARPK